MGWIKNRIDSEYKKHKTLDWSKIAESKINETIDGIITEWAKYLVISYEEMNDLKLKLALSSER